MPAITCPEAAGRWPRPYVYTIKLEAFVRSRNDARSRPMNPIVVILASQALFSAGDLIARPNLRASGFELRSFVSWWFVAYTLIRTVATVGQLYVFATVDLGRTMALFGAVSIVLANVLSVLLLGEVLTLGGYAGVLLAIIAFLVLALTP